MDFEIVGDITGVETFAVESSIREVSRLRSTYGRGRWRKRKGQVRVRYPDGTGAVVELHWYESHGIGRREFKIKLR